MLLVILGAGASYDAIPDRPPGTLFEYRLPLANQLFESRSMFRGVLSQFPAASPAIPHLIDIPPSESIEDRLEKMAEQARKGDPTRAQQLLAIQFYISRMIWACEDALRANVQGITNHATLIDEIRRRTPIGEDVFIVTFNYDRLIEYALVALGFQFNSIRDYVHNERFKVVKLHGSVDWVRPLTKLPIRFSEGNLASQLISIAPTLELSDEYELVSQPTEIVRSDVLVVPAVAVPVQQKEGFQCPASHVEALTDYLPKVTKILIVGWKGAEKPFLDLLLQKIPRNPVLNKNTSIAIVGGDDVESTKQNLEKAGITASKFIVSTRGFTTLTRTLLTDPWFDNFMARTL